MTAWCQNNRIKAL